MSEKGTFFWNLYGRCYDSIYHLMSYRKLLWDTYQALDLKPGHRVLDFGCGTGNLESFLAEKTVPPIQIEAVDSSLLMLAWAKEKCRNLEYVSFACVDLSQRLKYPDNYFDRIVAFHILYSLRNPQQTLEELIRVLKPAGRLIIVNPKAKKDRSLLLVDHFRSVVNIWSFSGRLAAFVKGLLLSRFVLAVTDVFAIEKKTADGRLNFLSEERLQELDVTSKSG
jgi:ubiquinone/menaquinone biosynthesis C-methylase UbiE